MSGGEHTTSQLDHVIHNNNASSPMANNDASLETSGVSLDNAIQSECRGIHEQMISDSTVKNKEALLRGFWHMHGNATRVKASVRSNNRGSWRLGPNVEGVLLDPRYESDDPYSVVENSTWLCILCEDGTSVWQHKSCAKTTSNKNQTCDNCWKLRFVLFNMFDAQVIYRMEGVPAKMNTSLLRYQSPTLLEPILEEHSYQTNIHRTQIHRKDDKIDKLLDKVIAIGAEVNWEKLMDPKEVRKLYTDLCSQEEVTEQEIMEYLFRECMAVYARIKTQGNAKGHRYSGLVIRFACMLRAKMSAASYDFFRKVFNLSHDTTLRVYSSADASSPDGPMMETIAQVSQMMMEEMKVPLGDFGREGGLSWDSHTIRDKLAYDPHSKTLTGYAEDAFNLDVILEDFKKQKDEMNAPGERCIVIYLLYRMCVKFVSVIFTCFCISQERRKRVNWMRYRLESITWSSISRPGVVSNDLLLSWRRGIVLLDCRLGGLSWRLNISFQRSRCMDSW